MDLRKQRARAGGTLGMWEQMGWLEGVHCRGRGWVARSLAVPSRVGGKSVTLLLTRSQY